MSVPDRGDLPGSENSLSWYRQQNAERVREWFRRPTAIEQNTVPATYGTLPRQTHLSVFTRTPGQLEHPIDVPGADEFRGNRPLEDQAHHPARYRRMQRAQRAGVQLEHLFLVFSGLIT